MMFLGRANILIPQLWDSRIRRVLVYLCVGLSMNATMMNGYETRVQTDTVDVQVERAIDQLGSEDEQTRAEAKRTLLRLSNRARASLIAKLTELVSTLNVPYPVPTGTPNPDLNEMKEIVSRSTQLNNILEITGQLRLEEAVPLLIRLLEERRDYGRKCEPFIVALIAIGPASVHPLIDSLSNAEAITERNSRRVIGGAQKSMPIDIDPLTIQLRAASALGDIGDVGALSSLEQVQRKAKMGDFWHAIQLVKKKNGLKYERWPNGDDIKPYCGHS